MKCKHTHHFYFIVQLALILLISFSFVQLGFTASIDKLYESSIRADTNKSENKLIKEAFTNVLIKVSGRSDVTASPGYKGMLKKAESAISQFRYDYKKLPSDDAGTEAQQDEKKKAVEEKEKWFWVRFNQKAVNELLKNAQIPIWGKIRPKTLIWFSQEVRGKRYLQSQHDQPGIYNIFKRQADKRGISLSFPFMDLQDQSSISASDIWGNFNDAILLASRRYQAQSTLTSRLFKEPSGLWVSQWNLLMLGEVQSWEIRNEKKGLALAAGIDKLADKLSRQFTQVASTGDEQGLLVQVNNISDYQDFQKVDAYLRNLATTKSVEIKQVDQDKIIYSINYLSSKHSFIQEIRLGDLLNSVELTRTDARTNSSDNTPDNNYKPVILDNMDGKSSATMSDREKALDSLAPDSLKKGATPPPDATPESQAELPQEKIVEKLQPELEYWLAR